MADDQSPNIEGGKITLPVVLDLSEAQKQYADMVEDFQRKMSGVAIHSEKGKESESGSGSSPRADIAPSVSGTGFRVIEPSSDGSPGTMTGGYSTTERMLVGIVGQMQEMMALMRTMVDSLESRTDGD